MLHTGTDTGKTGYVFFFYWTLNKRNSIKALKAGGLRKNKRNREVGE